MSDKSKNRAQANSNDSSGPPRSKFLIHILEEDVRDPYFSSELKVHRDQEDG